MSMKNGLRVGRRRKLAAALRVIEGGRRPVPHGVAANFPGAHSPIANDNVGLRLRDLAAEGRVDIQDSDQAELLARLRLDEAIPPEVTAAICAALLPILNDQAGGRS